ncbi:MAG TPA: IS200/IS605 family transposase [Chitinophagaceae bacterium]
MAYVDILVHAVWGTKHRQPLLRGNLLDIVCDHIRENAKEKQFFIREINGYDDHLHLLMALKADWSISKHLQMIKGESAYWINKKKLLPARFSWADEYYAASVGKDELHRVTAYIRNQREHHRQLSFTEEYERLIDELRSSQGYNPGLQAGERSKSGNGL